jgi:hypothetical protein
MAEDRVERTVHIAATVERVIRNVADLAEQGAS